MLYAVALALINRREAIASLAAAPLLLPIAAPADPMQNSNAPQNKRQYYEIRYMEMRNGTQPQRANDFLGKHFMPAAKRLGLGPVGIFNPVIGEGSPFTMLLLTYPSFADAEHLFDKLMGDSGFSAALNDWHKPMDPGYTRYESTLLRAFEGHPTLTVPPESKAGHIFELRTYESNSPLTLRKKIDMFNAGEAQIFQRLGMNPVFFAEAIVGSKLPHLTYMLAYDDLAARDRVWKVFGSDPEWQKLRAKPGLADAEIVSNISNSILRATAYSDIR